MIYLKSISIINFKGIDRLECEFDDLTVLAGLNNSGKTSLLQAATLVINVLTDLFAGVKRSGRVSDDEHPVDIQESLSYFGILDRASLVTAASETDAIVQARFCNNIEVLLQVSAAGPVRARLRCGQDAVLSWVPPKAEPLTPPGELPTREHMMDYVQFQRQVREGQGPRVWRNGLWWAIQDRGIEAFQPLASLTHRYFPAVELRQPRLALNETLILVEYVEGNRRPLDISQSGSGLRTFVSLARMLELSKAEVLLLDEPDSHLHASQQADVLDLLMEAAQGQRQVILTTHSPELRSCQKIT